MEENKFIGLFPKIYHMAESGSWSGIQEYGLLSTTALLDLFDISGEARDRIERENRRELVQIFHPKHGKATIRDNLPMSEVALESCLDDGLKPSDWYQILNGKVFFWASEQRLIRLLMARAYRKKKHDVLTIDSASLVAEHRASIELCPYNSGSTAYNAVRRGLDTFKSIEAYPFDDWRAKRPAIGAVVEVAVKYSVPNILDHVLKVESRQGDEILNTIYQQ